MPEPLRSPKQSRLVAKSRTHPYARPANSHRTRDVGLQPSNSLLGTIKSFVTAPLSWLSSGSQDSINTHQKRRVSGSERGGTPPRAKRARHDSPEVRGYLDPPDSLFAPAKPPILLRDANGSTPMRTMSVDPPPPSDSPPDLPLPASRGHSILSRTTMSVEPQASFGIRRSITRDLSMPPPSPFARSFSRSSLTPQPVGATFGPSPKRKHRESTAPPLLGPSTPSPMFTRPPPSITASQSPFPRAPSRGRSEGHISGLVGHNRQSVSPSRESPMRSMLIRDEVHVPRPPNKSAAERTLSTLESFRTPLHVSRFPSVPPAEGQRPRKVHVPIASKLMFDHTPEGRKGKEKRGPTIVGPYSSGMSGMRKLLARRREELEKEVEDEVGPEQQQERRRNRSEEPEVEDDVHEKRTDAGEQKQIQTENADGRELRKTRPQVNGSADHALPRTRSPTRSKPDGQYSTLRAPTSRVSRTHAPAPRLRSTRNKFSLNDDDDDDPEFMSVEEVKSYQAQAAKLQPHISFSPARIMSEVAMQTDADAAEPSHPRAASPSLPAQPQTFDSLLSRIGPPLSTATKPTTEFATAPQLPKPQGQPQLMAADTSTVPATLPFSFGASVVPKSSSPPDVVASPFAPPTPTLVPSALTPAPSVLATSTPTSGVPTFFSSSKTQFTPPKVPLGSLFGGPPLETEKKETVEPLKNVFGVFGEPKQEEKQDEKETQKEAKSTPFGGVTPPSVFGGPSTPAFGAVSSFGNNASGTPADTSSHPIGSAHTSVPSETPKTKFLFGTQVATVTEASKPGISILGAANKTNTDSSSASDPPPKTALSFDASPSTAASSHAIAPVADGMSKTSFSFNTAPSTSTPSTEAPKPLFPFGVTESSQPKKAATEIPKTPFSFGATPSTPPPVDKKPAFVFNSTSGAINSGFSFGSGASSNGAVNGTSADAPKPLFVGFGNVTTPQKPPEATSAEGGDGMEMAGDQMEDSPTRTVDKKDVSTSQLPQSTLFGSFGGGSSSNNGSTGFAFGQAKPASTNAFSFGQSKPSTTPAFAGFGQSLDKLNPGANTNTGFSFGNDATKAVGLPQSSFTAPLNTPFGAPTSSSTSPTSFSFGQPAINVNANPFGQQQRAESGTSTAPSSPSLFPQPTPQQQQQSSPFSFNATASNNAFPSSNAGPATPSSPNTQPFQFGTSNPAQPAGSTAGNNMFTLGGAATPPRKVKGLPNRRGKRP